VRELSASRIWSAITFLSLDPICSNIIPFESPRKAASFSQLGGSSLITHYQVTGQYVQLFDVFHVYQVITFYRVIRLDLSKQKKDRAYRELSNDIKYTLIGPSTKKL